MRLFPCGFFLLPVLAAGCVNGSASQIQKLTERTLDLHSRLQVVEEAKEEHGDKLRRLQSLYQDLEVRYKDLQFEIRLLRAQAQPFASKKEEQQAQERAMEIIKKLGTEDDSEWPAIKEELVAMGHTVVPFLLEVYRSKGAQAMTRAAEVLRAVRDPRALESLVTGLQHPDTRGISAEALGNLGMDKAARHLAPHLEDERPIVRLRVAEALADLGDLSGVPILIDWLEHPDDSVRLLAVTTLRRLTGKKFDFDPYGAESDRKEVIGMWRKWWRQNKKKFKLAVDIEAGGTWTSSSGEEKDERKKDGNGGE